jgi:hypothetical protein
MMWRKGSWAAWQRSVSFVASCFEWQGLRGSAQMRDLLEPKITINCILCIEQKD